MHYAIGDVHGCYDEMMQLINKIEAKDPEAEFLFVGDFVDRGPKVTEVLKWMLSHINQPDGKYRSVRGNHEQMVIDWYNNQFLHWHSKCQALKREAESASPSNEDARKSYQSLSNFMPSADYDFHYFCIDNNITTPDALAPYITMFLNMPLHIEVPIKCQSGNIVNYKIIHAGYSYADEPYEHSGRFSDRMRFEDECLWSRSHDNFDSDEIWIHGHTPTFSSSYYIYNSNIKPGLINYEHNSINLDCGCTFREWYGTESPCVLAAICLETLEEFYNDTIEERMLETATNTTFIERFIDIQLHEAVSNELVSTVREQRINEMNANQPRILRDMKAVTDNQKTLLRLVRGENQYD